jgi:hypothetical protein
MGGDCAVSALDVIRRVEALGGRLVLDAGQLRLRAATPLPADVVSAVQEEKVAIMVALGAPLDTVINGVLDEVRPHLPPSLRELPDDKLLVLINWSIIAAWEAAIRKAAA